MTDCQSFGHFINGRKLYHWTPRQFDCNTGRLEAYLAAFLPERLNSLCTKFVIFLFLQQAQMFSKARLEDKRKKNSITFPHNMKGMSISGVPSQSMSLEPTPYPVPSCPPTGLCPRMRGTAREVTSTAIVGFLAY